MLFRIKAGTTNAAEILIYEYIGEDPWFGGMSAKRFSEELAKLGKVNTIDVRINSYGGDVFDGFAIYRRLVEHGATINVHIDGIAASIASVIAMAGKTIAMAESGKLMIHNAWTFTQGDDEDHDAAAGRLRSTNGMLADVYVGRTGQSKAKVLDWMRANRPYGTEFTAEDAVKYGFATSIAENLKMAAAVFDRTKVLPTVLPKSSPQLQAPPNGEARRLRFEAQRAQTKLVAHQRGAR